MKRTLVALVVMVLTACSGGSSSTPSGGPNQGPDPRAVALTLARQINLRSTDLKGFTATLNSTTAADERNSARIARCAGATPPSEALADDRSQDLTRGAGLDAIRASSETFVFPTADDVRTDLDAIAKPGFESCLQQSFIFLQAQAPQGVKFVRLTVTKVPANAPGTDGSFGFRFVIAATAGGEHLNFYADTLGFGSGAAEVSLNTFAIGKPFPAAIEDQAFSILVHRAVQNT